MQAKIKAVFFDMDGTLITDNRTISPQTIYAINLLRKKGLLVGLATGRDPHFLKNYMVPLNLDVAVAYNGQYVMSRQEVLADYPINRSDLRALIRYAKQNQRDVSFGTAKHLIGSKIMSFGTGKWAYLVSRFVPRSLSGLVNATLNHGVRRLFPQEEEKLLAMIAEPIYQVILLAGASETDRLATAFPNLTFTRSSPYAADIICKGNSKLKGIATVGEAYGFSLAEVMAFGDSDNDLEMLAGVGYGVAMGNASEAVKAVADYVTDSNNQNGIMKALVHSGLLSEDEQKISK